MDVSYLARAYFGSEPQRPWKKKLRGPSGQELVPHIDRFEVDKLSDLMLAAIDMGRTQAFRNWGDLAFPVGIVTAWPVPSRLD